ncbi:class I SAM-dependent methyltransferase [Methylobacterium sp. NEAU K]|uniref:class I SAM-dependent methyltransferase n=1 Tax=Methylobacterium sp. NEAU K TaxID=3064946 RepID=UPI002733FE6D|nr:class I SAM-dependent methyltransferase [Methylobacterium sp. NEAU K]MDP4006171.1 class I SAM-dependent methyltransferase [Methylobacterium sp. NEAU K]
MSGFSSYWLGLREPADNLARDAGLVAALADALPDRQAVAVVDLGCGTGSNLRALAPHLPPRQAWTLIDHDPVLLAAARETLAAWADQAEAEGEDLVLDKGGKRLRVTFASLDLAAEPARALDSAPDLITAAALFDLVSRDWLDRFVAAVAAAAATFYTALSYDGTETWHPPHPADAAMQAAFLGHQGGDKGFGAALGPGATAALAEAFSRHGYVVRTAASPWHLGPDQGDLIGLLKAGKAQAVRETGLVHSDHVEEWEAARGAPGTTVVIGHADLLAQLASAGREHPP